VADYAEETIFIDGENTEWYTYVCQDGLWTYGSPGTCPEQLGTTVGEYADSDDARTAAIEHMHALWTEYDGWSQEEEEL
jgi:hypothetical protein